MQRRFQNPRVKNIGGYWIARYKDSEGVKRKVSFGPVRKVKKYDAETQLKDVLAPINARAGMANPAFPFGQFVKLVYFPFYGRKWKTSTAECNDDRFKHHLAEFGGRPLNSFTRDDLQEFLDRKAAAKLSYSVVAHLRWDLRQIFRMAVSEGYLDRNPAELLFIPREARRPNVPSMDFDQVKLLFSVLDLRERMICGLAIIAGMRPGEIFALKRAGLEKGYVDITQRVYRGKFDTPKTFNSIRWAAMGGGLENWIKGWLEMIPSNDPDAWVFPSETGKTPLWKDNVWRRHIEPRLGKVGLDWVNFQVFRRTHSCLEDELGVDPQVRADQMGHGVDVNQNKYTSSSLARRQEAVNRLGDRLGIN